MIPDRAEISSSLFSAWRLFRMDADAMSWFDTSMDGFWRSFFAAVIALPTFLLGFGYHVATLDAPPNLLVVVVVGGVAYVASWVVFPVVAALVVRPMGYGSTYVPYIVARNWAGALVALVYLVFEVLVRVGFLGEEIGGFVEFILFLITLWYGWLVARVALETTVSIAAAMVIIGTVIDIFIAYLLFSAV